MKTCRGIGGNHQRNREVSLPVSGQWLRGQDFSTIQYGDGRTRRKILNRYSSFISGLNRSFP